MRSRLLGLPCAALSPAFPVYAQEIAIPWKRITENGKAVLTFYFGRIYKVMHILEGLFADEH